MVANLKGIDSFLSTCVLTQCANWWSNFALYQIFFLHPIGKKDFDDHKKKTSNPNAIMDINTLSDISNSLDKDDHVPNDVMKILENQESILQYTRDSVNELREVLATGDS